MAEVSHSAPVDIFSGARPSRRSASRARDTLPRLLTTFVGRSEAVDALVALVNAPGQRLVTISGPGGVGKTRLAIAVAEHAAAHFPDGAWFVPLATVSGPEQLYTAIVQTFGIRESGSKSVEDDIVSYLRDRRCLVILDNFEHLIEAAPFVADLVNACPEPVFLVTSRSLLRLRVERNFPLSPLPAKAENARHPDKLPDAVRLFAERAKSVRADFAITSDNIGVIQAICDRLDGLPLAIELAAARTRFLAPQSLLERITAGEGDQLRLLAGGPRDAPERQRSLRDTIAWSYDLLEPLERSLFCRLSIFPGGFDVDSAAAVNFGGDCDDDERLAVYEGIASLLDKSLLLQRQMPEGDTRFLMLATVRDFVRERLAASSEYDHARSAHAQYFLGLSERAADQMTGSEQRAWQMKLANEHSNLIAALEWFHDRGEMQLLQRMAWSLFSYWWHRGLATESRSWYERLLLLDPAQAGDLRPWIEYAACISSSVAADFDRVEKLVEQAFVTARSWDNHIVEALIWAMDAYVKLVRCDNAGSIASGERAVEIVRAHAMGFWLAMGLAEAGLFIAAAGKPELGISLMEQGLELDIERGDALFGGVRLSDLGVMFHDQGNEVEATERYLRSIDSLIAGGGEWYLASPMSGIAAIVANVAPIDAAQLLGAARELRQRGGTEGWATEMARDEQAAQTVTGILGGEAFEASKKSGCSLSIDELVDLVNNAVARWNGLPEGESAVIDLTEREREVLQLIVSGVSDREIGDALFISPRTASKHVGNILAKLGVSSRSEAAVVAIRQNLI